MAANGAAATFFIDGPRVPRLVLNASTGALTGNLTTAGDFGVTVIEVVRFSDGSIVSAQIRTDCTIVGPSLTYNAAPFSVHYDTPFSSDADPIANALPGDVFTFSVMPSSGETAPLPGWLNIDPATGRLFGVGGPNEHLLYSVGLTIVMTTRRHGHDYETSARVGLSLE